MRPNRRKVVFVRKDGSSKVTRTRQHPRNPHRQPISSGATPVRMDDSETTSFPIPAHLSSLPILKDSLTTATSSVQDLTVQECLPLITRRGESTRSPFDLNEKGVVTLDRSQHIEFLADALEEYPAQFVGVDASRPWLVYWALMGLHLLGEDVTKFRARCVISLLMRLATGIDGILRFLKCFTPFVEHRYGRRHVNSSF